MQWNQGWRSGFGAVMRYTGVWVLLLGFGIPGCKCAVKFSTESREGPELPEPTYLPAPAAVQGPAIAVKDVATEPPFVGEAGNDPLGYPYQHPDQVALMNLLRLGHFDALERFFTYYQEQYEADFHKERWPADAANAFKTADPALGPIIEQWIQRSPNAFSAWLVRGVYNDTLGWHMRGNKFARETSKAQMDALDEHVKHAVGDFNRALELRPRLQVARHFLILAGMSTGVEPAKTRVILDAGLAQCPLCYSIRSAFMHGLQPRWGGSWPAMEKFAGESFSLFKDNPKLEVLRGASAADRCKVFRSAKQLEKARVACEDALRYGDEVSALVEQARVFVALERTPDALASLGRALRVEPQHTDALELRQQLRIDTGDYLGAARDVILVRHLQPTDGWIAERVTWLVKKLAYEGSILFRAGKNAEAAPYFQLGLELDPNNVDMMRRQGWAARDDADALLLQAASRPDDFELRLQIDHALATKRQFDEIVKMWDAFIVAHPQDPRPQYERGGAKWHLGKRDEGIADVQKACALGMQKACEDVVRMQGRR